LKNAGALGNRRSRPSNKQPPLVDAQDTNGTGYRLLMAAAVKP